jgi:hypothetical protein
MADCTHCSAVRERHKPMSYPKLPNLEHKLLEKQAGTSVNPTALTVTQ